MEMMTWRMLMNVERFGVPGIRTTAVDAIMVKEGMAAD